MNPSFQTLMNIPLVPTFDDVIAASKRIEGHVHRTPVLTSHIANEELSAKVFFKFENFQIKELNE